MFLVFEPIKNPVLESTMNMETLEFIIYPDGRVKESVTGIVGSSCQEVTAAIEAQLGRVLSSEKTSEYYEQTNSQSAKVANKVSSSDWWELIVVDYSISCNVLKFKKICHTLATLKPKSVT